MLRNADEFKYGGSVKNGFILADHFLGLWSETKTPIEFGI